MRGNGKSSELKALLERVFAEYSAKKDSIVKGIISAENIQWVSEKLSLGSKTLEELSDIWFAIDDFFLNKTAEFDEAGEVIAWKAGCSFEFDTDSAWKEVVNLHARKIKKGMGLV